jgi:hypothetical protein
MSFEDDLKAVQTVEKPFADVPVMVNGNLHTFRFTQMEGADWAAEADKYPIRPGVMIDQRYGYNLRALIKGIAPKCGARLVDGELVELRVDPPAAKGDRKPRVDEWAMLFKAINGFDFQRVSDAIWSLNEWLPQQAVEAAKKALDDSAKNSN